MRDRAIVLFLIVLQVVAMATQIHAPIVALFTIALASWAMLGTWQSMGAVVLEGNTETASSRKNADSNWHLVRRLVLGTSAGRRAVLCLLLVVVPAIRLAMKWFDPQQSTIGIMCELMLPAFVICQGILVWMLVRERNPGRGQNREADGYLLLPLACATIVILLVHWQSEARTIARLLASIGAVAGFAMLADCLTRDRWLASKVSDQRRVQPTSMVFRVSSQGRTAKPTLLIFLAFATLTWSLSARLDKTWPSIQAWLDSTFYDRGNVVEAGGIGLANRYVEEATLSSIKEQIFDSPQRIAFRVTSLMPPGYMRGRVFEKYDNGRWGAAFANANTPAGRRLFPSGVSPQKTKAGVELTRFLLSDGGKGRLAVLDIENDPTRGIFYFTPLGVSLIEGNGRGLRLDRNDIPRAGLSVQDPYRSIIYERPKPAALDEYARELYLMPSPSIDRKVKPLADSICGDYTTARSKAAAIQRYLRSQFTYSLDAPNAPKDVDALVYFLEQRHPAHCEYFATAAAILLRNVGVACRYVTGYVVTELSDSEDYWLARNRNAHAWVEAYDDERQEWFVVEATPGQNFAGIDFDYDQRSLAKSDTDASANQGKTSRLSRLWNWLTSPTLHNSVQRWLTVARIPLAVVVLALLFFRFFNPIRQRLAGGRKGEWHKIALRNLDAQASRCGLVRKQGETIHQFAKRVDQSIAEHEQMKGLGDKYRRYALARYAGLPWEA
jgi:transglutaminase-like putative cysteine protease